ncbi:MAG: type II CRISPR RNA-guided endonuclease Cas9 [Phycisphaerales bacterium]
MKISLGLDVGSTSIGWALIDEEGHRIMALGSRIFPEGVDRDQQGGEQSKSQARRTARGMRRLLRRRAKRKQRLRDLLTSIGLLPADAGELHRLLDENPYALRRRALDEALALHELGRIILHLNQRRGFRSSRKTDKGAADHKGMLREMDDLAKAISDAGCRTLGEYLANINTAHQPCQSDTAMRVRNRHTRRDMYRQELEEIWKSQAVHHADLTDELRDRIAEVIFFQRDIYWPRSVIGHCELVRNQKRCPKADRQAQRFRMLQEINNLRLLDRGTGEERQLSNEERAKLLAYLATSDKRSFDQIRKKLGLLENVQFNFERGERDKLDGLVTETKLNRALKPDWAGFDDAKKDRIVSVLIEEDQEERALRRLVDDCGLSGEQTQKALAVHLPDKYMNFCRAAIARLLPYLERGLPLMGNDASDSALHAAGYLRPDERVVAQRDDLPPIPDLPNPIVRQALVEVRKVVNAVIREYGKPDEIHVELAREAKKSFEERKEIRFENAKRRKIREGAKQEIEDRGPKPTRSRINRYTLWQEQHEDCPYCGKKISQSQLFDEGLVDVDHILPRWRSLDDSLGNKVVAHRACNAVKGDRTPREWLESEKPAEYERMLQTIKVLPYGKQLKFQQKDIVLDEFVNCRNPPKRNCSNSWPTRLNWTANKVR